MRGGATVPPMTALVPVTGNPEADQLLTDEPLALMIGMLLDQQIPMEWAFAGPLTLRERMGGQLDATKIAATDPDEFAAVFKGPPALHRFPGSMGKRTQDLCQYLVDHHGGDAAAVWTGVDDGAELVRRVRALPGFGAEKAKIFTAMLAKRFGIRPPGLGGGHGAVLRRRATLGRRHRLGRVAPAGPGLEEDDEGGEEGQGRHPVAPDTRR